ncbi:MAG: DUF1467 family protein [Burkholderiales bacterium]
MNWLSYFFTYLIIWWVVLFCVLPWGIETKQHSERGEASSAPKKPRLLLKFTITSAVSIVVTYLVEIIKTAFFATLQQ